MKRLMCGLTVLALMLLCLGSALAEQKVRLPESRASTCTEPSSFKSRYSPSAICTSSSVSRRNTLIAS